MLKEIRFLPREHLNKRLRKAGYYQVRGSVRRDTFNDEWRKSHWHLIVHNGKRKIKLNLHYDSNAHLSWPRNPLAHSRQQGKDVERELNRIVRIITQIE